MERLRGRIPVAHNAPFDVGFLQSEWDRINWGPLELRAFDTLPLARALGLPGRLGALAAELDVDLDGAHQALDDTRALAGILVRMLARAAESGVVVERIEPFFPKSFGPSPSGRRKLRLGSSN